MTDQIAYETKSENESVEARLYAIERKQELTLQLIGTLADELNAFCDRLDAEQVELAQ